MQQLPLEISSRPEPRFENFVPGANREALEAVQAMARGTMTETIIYLWGEPASGRTHLLRAAAHENPALTVVDDVEGLPPDGQQRLFIAINEARAGRGAVLVAGALPPAQLSLREDLRTRLAWGLVYQLRRLSDPEKLAHLRAAARSRGLELPEDVANYLLARMPRDLASLTAVLDRLDRLSLAKQRPLSIPLVREALGQAAAARELLPRQGESG
jgi:DnaA family protein